MIPQQRDIVEVQYAFPDGTVSVHMIIVLSHPDLYNIEDTFYGVVLSSKKNPEEYSVLLTDNMLTKPISKITYVKTHLIQNFYTEDITKYNISKVTLKAFAIIKAQIVQSIFEPLP
jgi:hypothetical protein